MPVYVSEPVEWLIEFRCFILNSEVATLSIYSRNGILVETNDGEWLASDSEINTARTFITTLLNDNKVKIPPACVIDIGNIKGRGWAVVEANPVWASGIYGCNPHAILNVLARSCIEDTQLSGDDAIWKINRFYED